MLLVLLALQYSLLFFLSPGGKLGGDEPYYVDRATYIAENHSLPGPLSKTEKAAQNTFGQWSDYRPVGYPMVLAGLGVTEDTHTDKRRLHAGLNFFLMAISLIAIFYLFLPRIDVPWARWAGAFLLGVQPWAFAFISSYYPDSLNTSLFFLGTLLLFYGTRDGRRRRGGFVAFGSLLLGFCIFLRPEMLPFVFVPPVILGILVSMGWRAGSARPYRRLGLSLGLLACFVVLFVGHRYWFERELFPRFVHATPGLEEWGKTWVGTERERYGPVWGLRTGQAEFSDLPSRAFGDRFERDAIVGAFESVHEDGYSRQTDSIFQRVAEKRRENWLTGYLIPRTWFMVHLWVNTETNSQLLHALSHVDSTERDSGILDRVEDRDLDRALYGFDCVD